MSTEPITVRLSGFAGKGWQRGSGWTAYVDSGRVVQGTGKTRALATADLAGQISRGLAHWREPEAIMYGLHMTVVHMMPDGSIAAAHWRSGRKTSSAYWAREEGWDSIVAHERAMIVQAEVTDWADDAQVSRGWQWLTGHGCVAEAAEHLRYAGWQRAFKAGEAQGVTGEARWQWAGDHGREYAPQLSESAVSA